MILAGIILAESALDNDDLYVVQTQSYGPESRGGASRAEVVISDEPIDYPKVIKADLLLALTQEALNKYGDDVREGGNVIADESFVETDYQPPENVNYHQIPIIATAEEEIGLKLTANMVALGAASHFITDIESDKILEALLNRVPAGTEDKNKAAFEAGISLIKGR